MLLNGKPSNYSGNFIQTIPLLLERIKQSSQQPSGRVLSMLEVAQGPGSRTERML